MAYLGEQKLKGSMVVVSFRDIPSLFSIRDNPASNVRRRIPVAVGETLEQRLWWHTVDVT
jgi:hypothetical protein